MRTFKKLNALRALARGSFPASAFLNLTVGLYEHDLTLADLRAIFNGIQRVYSTQKQSHFP